MPKSSNQKLKTLYLLKILMEKTDENHTITVPEMISGLEMYGISAERKSIYDDIDALKNYGIDIICKKTRTYDYYVGSRTFELAELKLLADAVASSKFITEKKSDELIKKIGLMTSSYEAGQLRRNIYVSGRAKAMNEKIYYNVDTIHQAISMNRQISFRYFEYDIEKNKRYRNSGEKYAASPYALTWDDENYYMISRYEKHEGATHFRVDKMEDIEVLDIPSNNDGTINVAEYAKKVFGMFSGEELSVRVMFDNSLVGVVIDRFGKSVIIRKVDENNFTAALKVEVSPPFFAWIFQFGTKVKILSPDAVREKFIQYAEDVAAAYK